MDLPRHQLRHRILQEVAGVLASLLLLAVAIGGVYWWKQGRLPEHATAAAVEAAYAAELAELEALAQEPTAAWDVAGTQERMLASLGPWVHEPAVVEVSLRKRVGTDTWRSFPLVAPSRPPTITWDFVPDPDVGASATQLRREAGRDHAVYLRRLESPAGETLDLVLMLDVERMRGAPSVPSLPSAPGR